MKRILLLTTALCVPLLAVAGSADTPAGKTTGGAPERKAVKPAEEGAQSWQSTRQKLDGFLRGVNVKDAEIAPIKDPVLKGLFPTMRFFSVRLPPNPAGVKPPAPLGQVNVIAVPEGSGDFRVMPDSGRVMTLFSPGLAPQKSVDERKDVVRAWLRLCEELTADGPYTFTLPAGEPVATKDGKQVSGKAVVSAGGEGQVEVKLYFNDDGRIASVSTSSHVSRHAP